MGLQSLERRLERMVEGVFRGSRAAIRPIELGRRLVREMDEQRSVDVKGRRIVPNDFLIHLSPRDLAGFDDIHDVLQAELVEAAREYAREEGYHFMGPVRVELAADDQLRGGRFNVVASLRQSSGGVGAGSLVLPSGQRVSLGDRPVTIGRQSDCTHPPQRPERQPPATPRSAPGVGPTSSSTSARRTAPWSTARASVPSTRLSDGDILSFGSTYVRFEAS